MSKRIDYTELRRLRDSGMRTADIAARLGCSEGTVHAAAKRFGWPKRSPGTPRKIDVAKLFKLWHSDMETPEIALEIGVSLSTLHTLRIRHKLPKKTRATVKFVADPTPDEIAQRARECRERHYAERRGEIDLTAREWRAGISQRSSLA